jgi:hypothetical protein
MTEHLVEVCPDDPADLKLRLDQLVAEGAEIVSVLWQAARAESEQTAAYDASGSFVIVARTKRGPLRSRATIDANVDQPAV